eukprot:10821364-Lingulodinium_polyedra.AAC.1
MTARPLPLANNHVAKSARAWEWGGGARATRGRSGRRTPRARDGQEPNEYAPRTKEDRTAA